MTHDAPDNSGCPHAAPHDYIAELAGGPYCGQLIKIKKLHPEICFACYLGKSSAPMGVMMPKERENEAGVIRYRFERLKDFDHAIYKLAGE